MDDFMIMDDFEENKLNWRAEIFAQSQGVCVYYENGDRKFKLPSETLW